MILMSDIVKDADPKFSKSLLATLVKYIFANDPTDQLFILNHKSASNK